MKHYQINYGDLSESDWKLIADLVQLYRHKDETFFVERLHYIFGSDFSIKHCLALGLVIGRLEGAEMALDNLQHNLNKCSSN